MYDSSNKKMLIMMILEILKKYSDDQHKMTQPDIIHYLDTDYGVTCDRRSVKRNILDLIELGYDINIEGGYYLQGREFSDEEVCLLYDSLLQNMHLTKSQLKSLMKKISAYPNTYFGIDPEGIRGAAETCVIDVKKTFEKMAVIGDAIERKKKICFTYMVDGEWPNADQRVINPYEIVALGTDYYLICSINMTDMVDLIRISSMDKVSVLDEKVKPLSQIKGGKKSIPSWSRLGQHITPKLESEVQAVLQIDPDALDVMIIFFGSNIKVTKTDDDMLKISLKCGEKTLMRVAMAYCDQVQVVSPDSLKEKIATRLKEAMEIYK